MYTTGIIFLALFKEGLVSEPVKYRLAKPMQKSDNPIKVIFNEWGNLYQDLTRNTSFANRMNYIFMPSG
jgi:hypothetical protein